MPWDRLSVDLIGLYKIEWKGQEPLMLQAVTMINPATGWFEIVEYDNKRAAKIVDLVEQMWLARYPRPSIIMYDQGKEFLGQAFKNSFLQDMYGISQGGHNGQSSGK